MTKIMTETIEQKQSNVYDALADSLDYSSQQAVPELQKVVVTSGIGSTTDAEKIKVVQDRLAQICAQKPVPTKAKESIAGFNTRAGDVIGYKVTLRGQQMQTFLNKLIHIVLPRTKDFRGIDPDSIDEMGNITIGIDEHTAFPETSDEDLDNVFGLGVTVVTTAESETEAYKYLDYLGVPFADKEE
jgi:large subunit ribosomal protein L5